MPKKHYFVSHCIRLGEMPLFLIYYDDKRGRQGQCVMLCTFKKLRALLRKKEGFADPASYGHIVYNGHSGQSNAAINEMLKARYAFDLGNLNINDFKIP